MSESNQSTENRKRNAAVKQNRHSTTQNDRAMFDGLGLTKRNAEYMFKFNQALEKTKLSPEKKTAAVNQMVTELVEGQKAGKTAKNLYGDIEERVKIVVEGPRREPTTFGGVDYWPNMVYNALTFFMIFNLMFGIMFLVSPSMAQRGGVLGITSIIVSAIIAGLVLPLMPILFDPKVKHRYNGWIRALILVAGFLIWMALFYASELLPRIINPVLNPWVSIALGVIAIGGMMFIRRQYKIRNSLF